MKTRLCFMFAVFLLAGCGGKPTPVWISASHKQLETFKQDFLIGREPTITEIHFRKAVEELKKGGVADLLGKAWLTRMALQVAVQEEPEDSEYLKTEAVESVPANRNFYRFIKGNKEMVDVSLLPESYRPFSTAFTHGDAAKAAVAIAAIEDPLSRLIASGLAVSHRMESEMVLNIAVETASQNGWKRALLVWLERLKSFHETAGHAAQASSIRSRLELIK